MSRIHSRAAIAALVAAVTLIPAVAGCGQVAEKAAEMAAEQAIGGDIDVNDNSVTVTDDEGNEVTAGEDITLPDTWPSQVPPYEAGTLSLVTAQADGSAFASWLTDATPEEAAMSYGAVLEDAGYTIETESNMGGMFVREYTGNGYTVSFNTIASDGQTTVMVTAAPGS